MTAVDVHYQIERTGAGRVSGTVVFAGSLGSTLEMWEPQVETLSRYLTVVRYDTRGHGRSAVPAGPYCIDDLADDLLALLDRLDLEKANIVGLSLGGMTAMRLAARNPDRVDRLALLCTSAMLGPAQSWRDRADTVLAGGTSAVADAVVRRWFTPGFAARHEPIIDLHREMIASTPPVGYAGCCQAIADMDLRDDLRAISAPTLAIAGLQDLATPPAQLQAIADGIAGSRLEVIDGGAHLVSAEQPDLANRYLLNFLLKPPSPRMPRNDEEGHR